MHECKKKTLSYTFHEIHKMFLDNVKQEANVLGINPTFRYIFMCLLENKDGLAQSEICEMTHLKKSSISLTLQQMEKEELISREKSNDDNRITIVKLTEKGKKLDLKLRQIFIKHENALCSALSEDELETLKEYLNRLIKVLKEENANV